MYGWPLKAWRRSQKVLLSLSDRAHDRAYRVDTDIAGFTLESRLLDARNHGNEGISYNAIKRILNRVRPTREDVFFDIGCGYGRALIVAARRPIAKAVGIELRPDVLERAIENAHTLRGKLCDIELVHGDALRQCYADASYIYMYNPFNADVMRGVLEQIRADRRGQPTRVVYANPTADAVLSACDWLEPSDRFWAPYQGSRMLVTAWSSK